MKKILALISALALGLSFAQAQNGPGPGEGSGTMDGSGPHGGTNGMWTYINDAIGELDPESSEYIELNGALTTVSTIREELRAARLAEPEKTVEQFRADHSAQIEQLQGAITTLRDWFRETRPDRPDPVMTGAMVQRRTQFQQNSGELVQLRNRLRLASENDPNSAECEQIREQIQQKLGERKGLLRDKRRGESSQSGDGNRKRGG